LKVKSNNLELDELASTDPLTWLKNVRWLEKEINRLIVKYKEWKVASWVSICLIDIDDFKYINDTHWHNNGDIVLKNLALLLQNYFWPELYSIFRKWWEEFVIISELDIRTFNSKINIFLDILKKNTLKIQSWKKVNITCSWSTVNTKSLEEWKIKPKNGNKFSKKEVYDIITSELSNWLNQAKAIPWKWQVINK
jgi:diguanylate cyclase (GGDEF)-like protein